MTWQQAFPIFSRNKNIQHYTFTARPEKEASKLDQQGWGQHMCLEVLLIFI